jgi:hypothetical protein
VTYSKKITVQLFEKAHKKHEETKVIQAYPVSPPLFESGTAEQSSDNLL